MSFVAPSGNMAPPSGGAAIYDIRRVVAGFYQIPAISLVSPCRKRKTAWARQVAMYLTRQLTNRSLTSIGTAFGHRHHTTVLHGIRAVAERMEMDELYAITVKRLASEIAGEDFPAWDEMTDKDRFADAVRGSAMLRDAILRLIAHPQKNDNARTAFSLGDESSSARIAA